ncbi:MAG: NAD(P)-dependent oxidoreductase [Gaiellaceae bacterium]
MPADAAPVAVIGLGAMGSRIATRLLSTGHAVVVWNRSREKATPLKALGAAVADTPAAAAANAEVVLTMVENEAALEAVTDGPTGLVAGVRNATTIIELSTVGPAGIARLSVNVPRGVHVLDAPVLGSIREAEAGTLVMFVGGPEWLMSKHRPLLSTLGTVEHVGPLGTGASAKLVANSTLIGALAVLAEAIALADGLGLSREATKSVLERTPLAAQAARRWTMIESGRYPARFTLSLARKDAELIVRAAALTNVDMRLATASCAWLRDAADSGWGEHDYSALLAHVLGQTSRRR